MIQNTHVRVHNLISELHIIGNEDSLVSTSSLYGSFHRNACIIQRKTLCQMIAFRLQRGPLHVQYGSRRLLLPYYYTKSICRMNHWTRCQSSSPNDMPVHRCALHSSWSPSARQPNNNVTLYSVICVCYIEHDESLLLWSACVTFNGLAGWAGWAGWAA